MNTLYHVNLFKVGCNSCIVSVVKVPVNCHCLLVYPFQIVNRIQKLRKKAALEPTDTVEVYFRSQDEDTSVAQRVLQAQVCSKLPILELPYHPHLITN